MKKLFEEWKIAFLAKGGRKITPYDEELFNDFFQWLQWKESSDYKKNTQVNGVWVCDRCGHNATSVYCSNCNLPFPPRR